MGSVGLRDFMDRSYYKKSNIYNVRHGQTCFAGTAYGL
jgi:hypothetical protein